MSHTYSYTYALLPEAINAAVGCIIELSQNADENTVKVYGRDKYVFALADKKPYHKTDDDRIRAIPLDELNDEHPRCHMIATSVGYQRIREIFVCVGMADISHLKL